MILAEIAEILAKPADQWTDAEWKLVDKGNREFGRERMYDILGEVGPKDG